MVQPCKVDIRAVTQRLLVVKKKLDDASGVAHAIARQSTITKNEDVVKALHDLEKEVLDIQCKRCAYWNQELAASERLRIEDSTKECVSVYEELTRSLTMQIVMSDGEGVSDVRAILEALWSQLADDKKTLPKELVEAVRLAITNSNEDQGKICAGELKRLAKLRVAVAMARARIEVLPELCACDLEILKCENDRERRRLYGAKVCAAITLERRGIPLIIAPREVMQAFIRASRSSLDASE